MCHWTMALNSDKTSKVFCINICCFSTRFYFWYHNGTVIQVSWTLWMFLISTPHKTRTFTVRFAVTAKYQGNGFAAEVLLGRDYPRVVPVGPIVRGVIVFPILGKWWDATTKVASQSVHLQASYGISNTLQQRRSANFNIWSMTVTVVRICCCTPNFIKIGARVRPTDAHNCWMSTAPLPGKGRCDNNPILADISGTWWDATSQVSSQ